MGGRSAVAVLVAGIVLVAIDLRAPVVAVSPLVPDLRADTGYSAAGASLLTTLPVLCFGLLAPASPVLARRLGLERAVGAMLVLIVLGVALRVLVGTLPLLAGTVLIGVGIAVANVLMPAIVKRDFPSGTAAGVVMGLYTMALNGGAAAAAGVTVPLQGALGLDWRGALALWGLVALASVVLWVPQLRRRRPGEESRGGDPRPPVRLSRDRMAWAVTLFMACQSLLFYSAAAWLPTILEDAGLTDARAGVMLALFAGSGAVLCLVVPVLATRLRDMRGLMVAIAALWAAGIAGLLAAPAAAPTLWMVLSGTGQGAGISLALMLVVIRARDPATSARLSGMAQAVGYSLAAAGPLLVGALHDVTDSWVPALWVLLAVVVGLLVAGLGAARPRFVGER